MQRRVCIAAMTGDAVWSTESLRLGPFNIGRGCKFLPQSYSNGMGVYHGQRALDVLAGHEVVILQHWPGQNVMRYLQNLGVLVGFWANVASFQRTVLWNSVQEPMRRACSLFPLAGTDGQNVETWPNADAVDTSAPILPDALAGTLDYIMRTSYPHARPDFLFLDEMSDQWYCTAANAPERDPREWQAGVDRIVRALQGMFPVWGHNTAHAFQAIRTRVYEHATRGCTTGGQFALRVHDYAAWAQGGKPSTRVVLGWERNDDIPAAWCRGINPPNAEILWQTARTGRAFQIFDPWRD